MSVSAVVYKRLENVVFPSGSDGNRVLIDDSTDEVYFDDASQVRFPLDDAIELYKCLGNIARIQYLRNEISRTLGRKGDDSWLLNNVLYDGTHCGDVIVVDDRDRTQGRGRTAQKGFI